MTFLRFRWLVTAAGLAVAISLGGCADPPDSQAPDKVRAVVMPYLTFMPFHIAEAEGLFAAQNLDVEFVRLERIQELMAGLARGDVDVAAGMLTINVLNSIAGGARVRLVGTLGYLDSGGCSFNALVARRELVDSGALADAARMRALTWDADVLLPYGFWLDEAVRPFGLSLDDLDIVNLPEAAAVEAVRNGSLDVTLVSEPFLSLLAASPDAEIWRRTNALMPDYQISVMMFGPTLLDERPEVGERFAAAMLAASRRFQEGKTEGNLDLVQRVSGLSREQVANACWPAAPADGRVDAPGFDAYQRWAIARGFAERFLPPDELVDTRFMNRANQRTAR